MFMRSEKPNGILVVNKPKGITSHDVVNSVRRVFGIKRVGHAGTLDPAATGVLIILVGSATKLSGQLMTDEKAYRACVRFGIYTDTQDSTGRILRTGEVKFRAEDLESCLLSFLGPGEQIPPMYSALRHKGKRLYKLARRGIEVERKPRRIFIRSIGMTRFESPFATIEVTCSKGTYIRQLCADIGERLGCPAHMAELERLRSGAFGMDGAIDFEIIRKNDPGLLASMLIKEIPLTRRKGTGTS